MCFSCICLFVLFVLDFVLFLFLLVSGVGFRFDCDIPWTFLLIFSQVSDNYDLTICMTKTEVV